MTSQATQTCTHLDQIKTSTPNTEGCEECMKVGDSWIALSLCLICGHVGCCYDSKGQHAWKHFEQTGHPLIEAFKRPGQSWRYCYVDDLTFQP